MSAPNIENFEAFDKVAGSLEDFAAENGHFRAMCPAHDGHRPALTIAVEGEPPNRKILLHCHAECGKQDILDALGLSKGDLFERPRSKASKHPPIVATYDYTDLAGNLVTQTTRHEPKDFRQRRPDGNGGWIWSIKDIEPVLYNLPAVTRTVMDGGIVFVCEGEKDCDRANEVLGAVGTFTTCPMGSGKWRESYTQTLRGANIVLIPDNDEPGKKHAEQVANALLAVAKSVRVLALPGVPEDGGDLCDWVEVGGTVEGFKKLVKGAESFSPSHHSLGCGDDGEKETLPIKSIGEFLQGATASYDWVVEGLVGRGAVTKLAGAAKYSGKTTLVMHMAANAIVGTPFLNRPTQKLNVLYLTEQGNNLRTALEDAGLDDASIGGFYILSALDVYDLGWPTLMTRAEEVCRQKDIGLLIVDTLVEFADVEDDAENSAGKVKGTLQPLKNLASSLNLGVLITQHHNINGRGRGSTQFEGGVDILLDLYPMDKAADEDNDPNVRLLKAIGRGVHHQNLIKLTEEGYETLSLPDEGSKKVGKHARVVGRVLSEEEEHAKTKKQVEEALEALGKPMSASTLDRALNELWLIGHVSKKGSGTRHEPHRYWLGNAESSETGTHETKDTNFSPSSPHPRVRNDGEKPEGCSEGGFLASFSPDDAVMMRDDGLDTKDNVYEFPLRRENPESPGPRGQGFSDVTPPITTPAQLAETLDALRPAECIALDLETRPPEGWVFEVAREYKAWRKGLKSKPTPERMRAKWDELKEKTRKRYAVDPATARVRLISLATRDGVNEVIDASKVDVTTLLDVLQGKTLILHNASFDLGVLRERYGYVHRGKVLDTQLLYLLHHYAEGGERTEEVGNKLTLPDPTKKQGMTSLATLAEKYLGVSLDKSSQSEDWSVPELSPEMLRYALEDSRVLLDLSEALTAALKGLGMGDVVTLESRALPAIIDMERNGFPASVEAAEAMAKRYAEESKAALKKLDKLTPGPTAPDGREWRWSIPEHVRAVLKLLGANLDELPKTGRSEEPSTAKDALRKISGPPEAVEWVATYLDYAALQKQENDFVNTYADLIKDGVIRGSYTKTVATGRLSCRKPNLQQVPSRGELQSKDGMRVRGIFRAPEGHAFVVADFAQVELLLAATLAGEEAMLTIFREGGDIHAETASWVLGKPKGKVTKAERTLAKALNFGLIYGCSAERLLESAVNSYGVKDLTLKKAKQYRKAFFNTYPALKRWHDRVERDCNLGVQYTSTPLGRRRKLPYWKDSSIPAHTVAKNAPVQGAGADAIKLTMAKLFEDRGNCPGNPRLRCSVHDEVVLTVEEDHKDAAIAWVSEHMAAAEREVVGDSESPVAVDVEARGSW